MFCGFSSAFTFITLVINHGVVVVVVVVVVVIIIIIIIIIIFIIIVLLKAGKVTIKFHISTATGGK
jgi:hypothetical protein